MERNRGKMRKRGGGIGIGRRVLVESCFGGMMYGGVIGI